MQVLARYGGEEERRPEECRKCGGRRFHRHGRYDRWILWELSKQPERIGVNRYLCVGCWGTTSVLPQGIVSYRLLCLRILIQSLYDEAEQRWRERLGQYRKQWERWYPELRGGIGNLLGRLPREAYGGWKKLGFEEVNPQLVDQSGWSLFGRYEIHAPQRVM